jgi:hypothetical protein
VPYVQPALSSDEGAGAMVAGVAAARRPGDAMAMSPAQLGTLLDWYDAIRPGHPVVSDTETIPGAVIYRFKDEKQTGRVWLVESVARARTGSLPADARSCGPTRPVGGGYTLRCVQLAPSR